VRSDLNKLLCERERLFAGATYKDRVRCKQTIDEDDVGGIEKMRRPYKMHYTIMKEFNENLNPLKGVLRKAVGRKWDEFFSDLSRVFDTRSVINRHIMEHLYDYVAIDMKWDGRELYRIASYGGRTGLKDTNALYYVDPRDRIIKVNSAYANRNRDLRHMLARRKAVEALTRRQIDKTHAYEKVNGTWFHLSESTVQRTAIVPERVGSEIVLRHRTVLQRVVKRRTVGKKELRANNLQ